MSGRNPVFSVSFSRSFCNLTNSCSSNHEQLIDEDKCQFREDLVHKQTCLV